MTDLPALIERLDLLAEHIGDDDYHLPLMSKSAVLLACKELERLHNQRVAAAGVRELLGEQEAPNE